MAFRRNVGRLRVGGRSAGDRHYQGEVLAQYIPLLRWLPVYDNSGMDRLILISMRGGGHDQPLMLLSPSRIPEVDPVLRAVTGQDA